MVERLINKLVVRNMSIVQVCKQYGRYIMVHH